MSDTKIGASPPSNSVVALERNLSPAERKKLMEVSKSFEAVFMNQMITAMRKTVTKGNLVPEGQGEKIYQSMLDSEYSQKMSQSGQMGLAKMIYHQLLRTRLGQ